MAIQELPTFPQITLSSSQGITGTRRFLLTGSHAKNWKPFVEELCQGYGYSELDHGDPETVPVSVQIGPWSEQMITDGGKPLGALPKVKNGLLVTVQYQYLNFNNPWPEHIKRPDHPPGTTLTLQTHGSGQYFELPAGDYTNKDDGRLLALTTNACVAQLVLITEYHITCGRLKPNQVPCWKSLEGKCNADSFLGEKKETLLFDSWELRQTFVPAVTGKKSVHYDLTAILRCREIPVDQGETKYVGWNHDAFPVLNKKKETLDVEWRKVMLHEKDGKHHPRYPLVNFKDLFFKGRLKAYREHLKNRRLPGSE